MSDTDEIQEAGLRLMDIGNAILMIADAMVELIENGLIVDSGKRRNRWIVWVAVPETKN